MVIPDWTRPRPPKIEFEARSAHEATTESLARPTDRLAAVIVDVFILLVPLFVLLSAPLKRLLTASFILGDEPDFITMIAGMTVLAVALLIAYQALMHRLFGATAGKVIFDLRVRPVFPGQQIGFMSQFLRAFVWVFEVLCLGLPFLSVFGNERRRCLHDRVSDTVVVARGGEGARPPALWERGLVRGLFAASLVAVCAVAGFEFQHVLVRVKAERSLASIGERQTETCDAVSRSFDSEDMQTEPSARERLNRAMSLYAAGLADRECLEMEIAHETATHAKAGPLTFLAQAFVNADDAEISNSYLDQVCEDAAGSVECTMSQVVGKWSDEDWESVEDLLSKGKAGSGYLEVWGVRHYMKRAHYEEALGFLDKLSDHHELAEFSLVQRVKALYDLHRESEAAAALAQALPVVGHEEGSDVSAWMCAQQLQSGCAALSDLACRGAVPQTVNEIDFEHGNEALSQVMALECRSNDKIDYLSFSESVSDEDWRTFFRALLKQQKNDRLAAFSLFSDVIGSSSASDLMRIEALRRVAMFADRRQFMSLYELWEGMDSPEAWAKSGNILFARLVQKNDAEWAMRVGHELLAAQALAPSSLAILTGLEPHKGLRLPASVPRGRK